MTWSVVQGEGSGESSKEERRNAVHASDYICISLVHHRSKQHATRSSSELTFWSKGLTSKVISLPPSPYTVATLGQDRGRECVSREMSYARYTHE